MARVIFRVTEVNDLTKDGQSTKRVVLEADKGRLIGTGPVSDRAVPTSFPEKAQVSGRFELLVDNATQAYFFPIGSTHSMNFGEAPGADAPVGKTKTRKKTAKRKAAKPAKTATKKATPNA